MRDEARRIAANDVTSLQHSEQFNRPPLVGPCLHTIRNQDLIVPFADGLTGRFLPNARGRLGGGGLFSFHRLSGQGVRGMGWPTRLVRESYGRIKRPQLVI
jgi:hypothetical protein